MSIWLQQFSDWETLSSVRTKLNTNFVPRIEDKFNSTDLSLNNKVDKITWKGLSTNDYTTSEKNKLSWIEAGAQVNEVNEAPVDWNQYARKDGWWEQVAWWTGAVDSVNWQTWVVVLDADDISDTTTTNKFVTTSEKDTWNNKSDFSWSYTDLTNKPTLWSMAQENTTSYYTASEVDTELLTKQDTLVSWTNIKTVNNESLLWTWNITISWWGWTTPFRITIPWEQIADTSNYQGLYFYNNTGATITISNVAFAVWKAAAWTWAACAFNLYKSSGTAADWLNTNAVALFTTAVDLWTWYTSLTNTPNTTTVENWRWITLRITSSAGSTNKASDAQCIITYS